MLTGTWMPSDGAKVAFELASPGLHKLGSGLPDIFFDADPLRSTVIVGNGRSKGPATMIGKVLSGTLRIFDEANPWAATPRHITLAFGCGHTTRMGEKSTYSPPREWTNRYVSQLPDDPAALEHIRQRLLAMDFRYDDTPNINPEQSSTSEGRVCQALWAGSLCAAMGGRQDDVRVAAEEFTDFQMLRRHIFCYDENGIPLTEVENGWWRAGPNGWSGEVKATFTSPESPYQFEAVLQHLAFDRFFELAVGFNDYAARLYTNCYIEAVHTQPEWRNGTTAAQQRTHGYCMQLCASVRLGGFLDEARAGAEERLVEGWRRACGFAPITEEPYAGFSPAHTGTNQHGWPSEGQWEQYSKANKLYLPGPGQDPAYPEGLNPPAPGGTCDHLIPWLQGQAVARGLKPDTFTFSKGGLWQPQTIVWMLGPVMNGLCDLRDAGAPIEDIHKLIQHAAACVTGPGRSLVCKDPTGAVILANPTLDCYLSRHPEWGMPGPGKNSTTRWLIQGLLRSSPSCGGNLAAECDSMAEGMWGATNYPPADAPINLETMGVLPIRAFGIKGQYEGQP